MSIERRVYSKKEIKELKEKFPDEKHLSFAAQFDGPLASQHRLYLPPGGTPRVEHTFITPTGKTCEIKLNYPDGFTSKKKGVISEITVSDGKTIRNATVNDFMNLRFENQSQMTTDMIRATRMLQLETLKERLKQLKKEKKSTKTLEKQVTLIEEEMNSPTTARRGKLVLLKDPTQDYATPQENQEAFEKAMAGLFAKGSQPPKRKLKRITNEEK